MNCAALCECDCCLLKDVFALCCRSTLLMQCKELNAQMCQSFARVNTHLNWTTTWGIMIKEETVQNIFFSKSWKTYSPSRGSKPVWPSVEHNNVILKNIQTKLLLTLLKFRNFKATWSHIMYIIYIAERRVNWQRAYRQDRADYFTL